MLKDTLELADKRPHSNPSGCVERGAGVAPDDWMEQQAKQRRLLEAFRWDRNWRITLTPNFSSLIASIKYGGMGKGQSRRTITTDITNIAASQDGDGDGGGGEKGCHKGRKRTWIWVDWWFGASLGTVSANPAVLVGKRKNPFYPTWYPKKEDFITSLQFILISFFFFFVFSKYLWLHICRVRIKKTRNPCFDASNHRNATFRVRLILLTSQEAKNGSLLVGKTLMARKETSVIHVIMDNTIGPTC